MSPHVTPPDQPQNSGHEEQNELATPHKLALGVAGAFFAVVGVGFSILSFNIGLLFTIIALAVGISFTKEYRYFSFGFFATVVGACLFVAVICGTGYYRSPFGP